MYQLPMSTHRRRRAAALRTIGVSLALAALSPLALADRDHERDHNVVPLSPLYTQECSSCHIAFPPGMLPAQSWQRLMGNLSKHYGTDASLDAATSATLTAWLADNAGGDRRVSEPPPQDRITRAAWFVREHREVSAATWKLPAVKSSANCAACHPQADRGDFNEHSIRIPR